ncbi:hypothetical protein MNBD_GAMMA22-112 [hydrothermal vent metagenome]|uniref:histidine kinase n=1 Tax=hydrothermal vent metagenome TaxID=652676 RepID=A0A3B1B1Y1_9ZZZZ
MPNLKPKTQFQLSRYFSITSLISIIATAVFLAFLFKQVSINNIISAIEHSNTVLTQTLFNSVKFELADYLDKVAAAKHSRINNYPIPMKLRKAIQNIMSGTSLVKIKIFDQQGTVVFSTNHSQIGNIKNHDDLGLGQALAGQVASELSHEINIKGNNSKTEYLISSYIPIRQVKSQMVIGAFELYSNVNVAIQIANSAQLVNIIGIIIILTVLYSLLLIIVRRSEAIIEKQQSTINERNKTLELFSSQLLTIEDQREERIAFDLHEGIAQNLTAIKMRLEQLADDNSSNLTLFSNVNLIVAMVQAAIQDTRDIAMDLRPPILTDFGLAATVKWACEKLTSSNAALEFKSKINIDEELIPSNLKVVIYRILTDCLKCVKNNPHIKKVLITLSYDNNGIVLLFEHNTITSELDDKFNSVKERSILSGGSYEVFNNANGNTLYRSSWSLLN